MSDYQLPPGLADIDPPPLWEMGAARFEDLGRALLEEQLGIASCEQYGMPGQTQWGIDLLADYSNGGGHQAGQCKCHQDFTSQDIKAAVDEFLAHWESRWRERGVKVFVLMVACDLKEVRTRERILTEKRRLGALGIVFQVWSRRTLLQKLMPFPGLVAAHFGRGHYWIERITGRTQPTFQPTSPASFGPGGAAADGELQWLLDHATAGFAQTLEQVRGLIRQGRGSEALAALSAMQRDKAFWRELPGDIRAKALRLEASLALTGPDGTVAARRLLHEAQACDKQGSVSIESAIIVRDDGPDAALAFLEDQPGSPEVARSRASCLLALGRSGEAIAALRAVHRSGDGETGRLLAVCLLAQRHAEEAERLARAAVADLPDSWLARMTLAIVLYHRSLSPAAAADLGPWPPPPHWTMVRRADDSAAALREARGIFANLVMDGQERGVRQGLEGWMLACLANDPTRQDEAERYCTSLLRDDRVHPAAISWALARNFEFDRDKSALALEALLAGAGGDALHVAALVGIRVAQAKLRKAAASLRKYRARFIGDALDGYYDFLARQVALRADPAAGGAQMPPGTDIAVLALAAALLKDKAAARSRLVELAKACVADDNHAPLLDCLVPLAQLGAWNEVAPFARELADKVRTAEAIALAAQATLLTDDPVATIEILFDAADEFPGGKLPRHVTHMLIEALRRSGRLAEATAMAEGLASDASSRDDASIAVELHMLQGETDQAARSVRLLKDSGPIAPGLALHLARTFVNVDPRLAREMLGQAKLDKLTAGQVAAAFDVAHRLGLGAESKPIVERLVALAAEGDNDGAVTSLHVDQIQDFLADRSQRRANLHLELERGNVPVHLLLPLLGGSLGDLLHADLLATEEGRDRRGMARVRNGGRQVPPDAAYPPLPGDLRVNMDVTALLLAQHLGILEAIEETFAPVRISSMAIRAIDGMIDDATRPEKDAEVAGLILDLLARNRVYEAPVADPAPAAALRPELAAVDVAVGWRGPWVTGAGRDQPGRANLSGLVRALEADGMLDAAAASAALVAFGAAGEELPQVAELTPGCKIHFEESTAGVAAGAALLGRLGARFHVLLDPAFIDMVRAEALRGARAKQLSDWLKHLKSRLSAGLRSGRYAFLPVAPAVAGEVHRRGDLEQSLLDLVGMPRTGADVVWADDRFLGGVAWFNGAPIAGTLEMARALVVYGRLPEARWFAIVHRLRLARVRYIQPVEGELPQLLHDALRPDGFSETAELAVMRRYLADCISDERLLQRPGLTTESGASLLGETLFVSAWSSASTRGIAELWIRPGPSAGQRRSASDWVASALDYPCYATFPVEPSEDGRLMMLASHLAGMIAQGFFIALQDDETWSERCTGYFEWLDRRLVRPRLKADPTFGAMLGQRINGLLFASDVEIPDDERSFRGKVLRRLASTLPNSIMELVASANPGVWDLLRTRPPRQVIVIGTASFDAEEFWSATSDAIAGRPASLATSEGTLTQLAIAPNGDRYPLLRVAVGHVEPMYVGDERNWLLAEDPQARRVVLERHPEWFDAADAEWQAIVDEPSPAKRMIAVNSAQGASMACWYERFDAAVRGGESLAVSDLHPVSTGSLARHLRLLPGDATFSDRLDAAARTLIAEVGLDEAFLRLSGLPTQLPEPFIHALAAEPGDTASARLLQWSSTPAPLANDHAVRSASRLRSLGRELQLDVGPLVARSVRQAAPSAECDVFSAVLRSVSGWFWDWPGALNASASERLALVWAHASRLFGIVIAAGATAATVLEAFHDGAGSAIKDHVMSGWSFRGDVAHPASMRNGRLALQGIGHALAGVPEAVLGPGGLDGLGGVLRLRADEPGSVPSPMLLRDQTLGSNLLGSFLGDEIAPVVLGTFQPELAACYRATSLRKLAEEAAARLAAGAQGGVDWIFLAFVLGDNKPSFEVSKLFEAARGTPLSVLCRENLDGGLAALGTVAAQAGRSGDPAFVRALAADVELILAQLRTEVLPDSDRHRALGEVFGAYVNMAAGETPEARARDLGSLVSDGLIDADPAFTDWLRRLVATLCRELPLVVAVELLPLLIRLRQA